MFNQLNVLDSESCIAICDNKNISTYLKLFIRVFNSYFLCANIYMANAMIADIKSYAVNLAIRYGNHKVSISHSLLKFY